MASLIRPWKYFEIRDTYDFVFEGKYGTPLDRKFSKTVNICRSNSDNADDTDVFVTLGFLVEARSAPQHLVDWNEYRSAYWLCQDLVYVSDVLDLTSSDVRHS